MGKPFSVLEIICLLLSAAIMATGTAFSANAGRVPAAMDVLVPFLVFALILFGVYFGFRLLADKLGSAPSRLRPSRLNPVAVFFLRAGIIFVCWLPYLLFLYPAVLTFDTSFQLCQAFGNPTDYYFPMAEGAQYTDHHPIMVTLFFGAFVKLGNILFGSHNAGAFLLVLFQALATAASFSFALHVLGKHGVRRSILIIIMLFFALLPVFPFAVATPTKDSLFSWLFIIYMALMLDVILGANEGRGEAKLMVLLAVVATCMSFAKKTGIFIVLLSALVLIVVFRKKHLGVFAISAVVPAVLLLVILPLTLFPALGVSKGSKIETLAPLYQQTARWVIDHQDDMTDEEYAAVDAVLGMENLAARYTYNIVDNVNHAWAQVDVWPSTEKIARYLKAYVTMGLRHPESYLKSFIALEAGWFDVNQGLIFAQGGGLVIQADNGSPSIFRTESQAVRAETAMLVANAIEATPVVGLLFMPPLYSLIIPVFCFLILVRRRDSGLAWLVPVGASFLFLMVSPCSTTGSNIEALRYLLPLIYLGPLLVGFSLRNMPAERKD